jgi:hypothetical protein
MKTSHLPAIAEFAADRHNRAPRRGRGHSSGAHGGIDPLIAGHRIHPSSALRYA